jgi:hypothetical protein
VDGKSSKEALGMRILIRPVCCLVLTIVIVLVTTVVTPTPTAGDSAPMFRSSIGISPGLPGNKVRMVAETVDITVTEHPYTGDDRNIMYGLQQLGDQGKDKPSWAYARVHAVFDMLNNGPTTKMLVGFPQGYSLEFHPIGVPGTVETGTGLERFRVWSGGTEYQTNIEEVNVDWEKWPRKQQWFTWTMTFPEGQPVRVEVSYEVLVSGYNSDPDLLGGRGTIAYILRSGALWEGTIGEARITVTATSGGALVGPEPSPSTTTTDRVEWLMQDFEPTEDVVVHYIPAADWQAIRTATLDEYNGTGTVAVYLAGARAVRKVCAYTKRFENALKVCRNEFWPQAIGWAKRAVAMEPENVTAWEVLGDLLEVEGLSEYGCGLNCFPQQAIEAYETAASLGSKTAVEFLEKVRRYNDGCGPTLPSCPLW